MTPTRSDVSNIYSRRVVSPRTYVDDGVQLEGSCVADGDVKWYNHSGKKVLHFLIILHTHLFYDPPVSFLLTGQKNSTRQIAGFFYSKQKQPTCLSPGECRDKAHPYNEILFKQQKMHECQSCFEWEKHDVRVHNKSTCYVIPFVWS